MRSHRKEQGFHVGDVARAAWLATTISLIGLLMASCGTVPDAAPTLGGSDLQLAGSDVGDPGAPGFLEAHAGLEPAASSRLKVAGAGADIWGQQDAFFYAHVEVSGDFTIEAQVLSIEQSHDWAKAGVMVRSSLAEDARNILLAVTAAGVSTFQVREVDGGDTVSTKDASLGGPPMWLRLIRKDGVVMGFYGQERSAYRPLASFELDLPATFHVGLAVTSHRSGKLAEAVIDMVWIDAEEAHVPAEEEPAPAPAPQPEPEPENSAPIAMPDTYMASQDTVLEVATSSGVLQNDSDSDGDSLSATLVDGPMHGNITLAPDGSFTYVPDASFAGDDGFTYQASDGRGGTAAAEVTLHVRQAILETDADFYVAPTGSDTGSGSITEPFATVQRAVDAAGPGDTILLRGGIYFPTDSVRLRHSGAENARIVLASYPGERAVLDGSNLPHDKPIIRLTSSYWHLHDLELRNGPNYGILVEYASHNVIERLESHHNANTGFRLTNEAVSNSLIDCDSHHNYDVDTGGTHADGFAITHPTTADNVLLRARAWNNSDDGFDLLDSAPQRIDQSVAFRNGIMADGTQYPNGDGNGFKLGIGDNWLDRYISGGGHTVTRSVAWENETWGFNSNNGSVPISLYNNTAWTNGTYDFQFNKAEHVLINNVSSGGKIALSSEVVSHNNSWSLGLSSVGFVSTDPTSLDFLLLSHESAAIDAGIDVGLPFDGAAPDLGAYEAGHDPVVVIGIPTDGVEGAVARASWR